MNRLILVATTDEPSALLQQANELSSTFDCQVYSIDFGVDGMQTHDKDVLDDGFILAIVEVSDKTTNPDLASVMNELSFRMKEPHIVFVGPQIASVSFRMRFPFVGQTRVRYNFVDPTDPCRHPDEMNRILREVFPKPQKKHERLAS